jgi:hypothetical protein
MRIRFAVALGAAAIAGAMLVGCAPQHHGTESLADEVEAAEAELSDILEKSAESATDALTNRMFTALGRDYRRVNDQMVDVPRGILHSEINERDVIVTMVFSTNEQTNAGLFGNRSNAYTCVEFTGTVAHEPQVDRHDSVCDPLVDQTYQGWRQYSLDELNF